MPRSFWGGFRLHSVHAKGSVTEPHIAMGANERWIVMP